MLCVRGRSPGSVGRIGIPARSAEGAVRPCKRARGPRRVRTHGVVARLCRPASRGAEGVRVTSLDHATVNLLLAAAEFGPARALTPLTGGKNNRVYRAETENGEAVLKAYFRHPNDTRDRLGAEFAFSRFAWASGIHCIPEPLTSNPDAGLGLFEYVNGRPTTASDVSADLIEQAIEFVRDLNTARWRPLASRLRVASEACFSIAEHLGTVSRRVDRLAAVTDPETAAFVNRELIPIWEEVRSETSDTALSLDKPLEPTARCVSPSDFGFHNTLLEADGRVRFLDFEYAGWDDPAKLICDFFCQPAVPVPGCFFEPFANAIAACFPDPESVVHRARLLMPVYRVKWVCIRLNEFLPTSSQRRAFSLATNKLEARRATQLNAARAALHQLQEAAA
ncbi:MAG: aminoglycoside phosphotransferase family protein [Planctomycetaceae bacterium]|nr:aminoglycoside phosphotransferase family protein [Planctomycetaceae bacterium]